MCCSRSPDFGCKVTKEMSFGEAKRVSSGVLHVFCMAWKQLTCSTGPSSASAQAIRNLVCWADANCLTGARCKGTDLKNIGSTCRPPLLHPTRSVSLEGTGGSTWSQRACNFGCEGDLSWPKKVHSKGGRHGCPQLAERKCCRGCNYNALVYKLLCRQ